MANKFKILLSIFILFYSYLSFAASPTALSSKINNIIRKYNPSLNIGVLVQSLNSGKIVYARNADQLFVPASSLKVFTAVAALSYLGADFRFQTKVFATTNRVIDGVLNGDVYFYFDGDPTLKRRDLQALIAFLAKAGIREIGGNIYIDDTVFDQAYFGPGWMWDERNFCYAAPTSAISIDKNCFPFTLIPAKRPGNLARIVKGSAYTFMPITSRAISRYISSINCPLVLHGEDDNSYYITGCVKPNSSSIHFLVAVRNMQVYAEGMLKNLFALSGIKIAGDIKFAQVPLSPQPLLLESHSSAPLSVLVKVMLKKSDNLIANALYKKLGAEVFNKSGTWNNGAKALKVILARNTGINFRKIRIVDGCGLSRYNLLSPRSLVLLLDYAYRDVAIRDIFLWTMPTSVVTGNLRGKISAKTGTMRGVTSLTGYIFTKSGKILVFTIMANNFIGRIRKYRALEDGICKLLIKL